MKAFDNNLDLYRRKNKDLRPYIRTIRDQVSIENGAGYYLRTDLSWGSKDVLIPLEKEVYDLLRQKIHLREKPSISNPFRKEIICDLKQISRLDLDLARRFLDRELAIKIASSLNSEVFAWEKRFHALRETFFPNLRAMEAEVMDSFEDSHSWMRKTSHLENFCLQRALKVDVSAEKSFFEWADLSLENGINHRLESLLFEENPMEAWIKYYVTAQYKTKPDKALSTRSWLSKKGTWWFDDWFLLWNLCRKSLRFKEEEFSKYLDNLLFLRKRLLFAYKVRETLTERHLEILRSDVFWRPSLLMEDPSLWIKSLEETIEDVKRFASSEPVYLMGD